MICPACEEISQLEDYGDPKCCPKCGAYYEKALSLRVSRKLKASSGQSNTNVLNDNAVLETATKSLNGREPFGHPLYKGEMYCTSCGAVGGSKFSMPGSILIEIILWICFFIPGLIYSVWRRSSAQRECMVCSMPTQIPEKSPLAQKMLNE